MTSSLIRLKESHATVMRNIREGHTTLLRVDTTSLKEYSTHLHRTHEINQQVAQELSIISADVMKLLALHPQGLSLGTEILELSQCSTQRASEQLDLAVRLEQTSIAYEQADYIATELLRTCQTQLPAAMYWMGSLFSSGGPLADATTLMPVAGPITSFLGQRIFFGMGYWGDYLYNGEEYANRRRAEKMKLYGISSLSRTATEYVEDKLHRGGYLRTLNLSGVQTYDASDNATFEHIEQQLVIPQSPADYAHNLDIISSGVNTIDELQHQEGINVEYDGVFLQHIQDESGHLHGVVAYVPGTDTDGITLHGGPLGVASNLSSVTDSPETPMEESSAGLQLLDTALEQANLPSDTPIYLAGFSQGGAIAAVASTHQQFRKKHNVQGIYLQGAPIGSLPLATDIPIQVLADQDDGVTRIQGTSLNSTRTPNVSMLETHYRETPTGAQETQERAQKIRETTQIFGHYPIWQGSTSYFAGLVSRHAPTEHGYRQYRISTENYPRAHQPLPMMKKFSKKQHKTKLSVIAGSTLPRNLSKPEILAHDLRTGTHVGAHFASSIAQNLPGEAGKIASTHQKIEDISNDYLTPEENPFNEYWYDYHPAKR
ncbi:hypothetical protein ACN083_01450 [Rothia sp. CCM 9418]|uniref:hypothetical protein n=1 Tax=Rothia sp. CCM 9418 TaxID=3402661 RepID=UPI003AD9F12F